MGKNTIPLISLPSLRNGRSENNGRLLRKPQKKVSEPLRGCISPAESFENDDNYHEQALEIQERWMQFPERNEEEHENDPEPSLVFLKLGTEFGLSSPTSLKELSKSVNNLQLSNGKLSEYTYAEDAHQIRVHVTRQFPETTKCKLTPIGINKQLLKTTIHSGPQGLPPPEARKPRHVIPFEMGTEKGPSEAEYMKAKGYNAESENDPALRISAFYSAVANKLEVPIEKVENIMYSRANFQRLTQMIHEKLTAEANRNHGQITLKTLNKMVEQNELPYRPCNHAVTGSRIPQTQILIQMASMLTEQIQASMEGRNVKAVIKPFPKWTPNKPIDENPRAEIILYEETSPAEELSHDHSHRDVNSKFPASGMIVRHTSEKHFMDSKRHHSPFEFSGDNGLNPTDMAIFDALLTGGAVLSLKAHFLDSIPDLSSMKHSLRYLNLAFNSLTSIPPEVLLLPNLEVLKLRNNPIREIPDEIRHLSHLRTFEMPFCHVSDLPEGLFSLQNLQYLDISYNKLKVMPSSVKKLKNLQVFFAEGNQLTSFPCSCLALRDLHYVRVRNNFMHPIFWPDLTKNNNRPQRLMELAGLVIKNYQVDIRYGDGLPEVAKTYLKSSRECDCCHGNLVGEGLTLIRPANIFGVKNLPFLFNSCSPYCTKLFMKTRLNLVDLVQNASETTIQSDQSSQGADNS